MTILSFEKLLEQNVVDTTSFWTEINKTIHFPQECVESMSSEKVELYIIKYNKSEKKLTLISNSQNRYFANESDKIKEIFEKRLRSNCEPFILKFYIHFDLEPWNYPNSISKQTNDGHLYDNEILVIKGWLPPIIYSE